MKFEGYFLIVQDFIEWAKKHGIAVGPGRHYQPILNPSILVVLSFHKTDWRADFNELSA